MPEWVEKFRQLITVEPVIYWYMTSTFIVTPAYQQLIFNKVSLSAAGSFCLSLTLISFPLLLSVVFVLLFFFSILSVAEGLWTKFVPVAFFLKHFNGVKQEENNSSTGSVGMAFSPLF